MEHNISGQKGGSKQPRTPIEAPDSLKSTAFARIVDLVSEGEIKGLVNGLQSIFYDEIPLQNSDGTFNFKNFVVDSRYGTPDQTHMEGFSAVENEIQVGFNLTFLNSYTFSINNTDISAVRVSISVPALTKQENNGDIKGYNVRYAIDIKTDGGAFVEVFQSSFAGKTTSKYARSHRLNLPNANSGWQIRVRRTTPNANSSAISDNTAVDSYTEIVDGKFRYPYSAYFGHHFDSQQFPTIPRRAYDLYGLIMKVPTNYDPETREYDGLWDGTFKMAYTDNPAWCFYAVASTKRWGGGRLIKEAELNKWELYKIGRYCDELVPDGFGGMEPRFSCNTYIQTKQEAFEVLRDMASIFRGMSYWAQGTTQVAGDMPQDPIYLYTPANVKGGVFQYGGSAKRARHTAILVTYNDLLDFCRPKIEFVEGDEASIERYGYVEKSTVAFACTSRGQARRMGRWILASEKLETDAISWTVGIEGAIAAPGRVVAIADPLKAGTRNGGRILSATSIGVVFDAMPEEIEVGDTLMLVDLQGKAISVEITSVNAPGQSVGFDDIGFTPLPMSIWILSRPNLQPQLARVLGVSEARVSEGSGKALEFTITAVDYEPSKFDYIDYEEPLEPRPTVAGILPFTPAVAAITVDVIERVGELASMAILDVHWVALPTAKAYQLSWRRDNGEWVIVPPIDQASFRIVDALPGDYLFKVTVIGFGGSVSVPTMSGLIEVEEVTTLPRIIDEINTIANDALLAAGNAQSTADNLIRIYRQETAPTAADDPAPSLGDYWQKNSTGIWYYNDSVVAAPNWIEATDTRIPLALTNASNAQATANSKNTIFYSETQPTTGFVLYDMWVKESTREVYQYNGVGWVKVADDSSAHVARFILNPSFEMPLVTGWADAFSNGATGWYTEAGGFTGSKRLTKYLGVNGASGLYQAPAAGGLFMPVSVDQRLAIVYTAWCNAVSAGELAVGVAFYSSAGAFVSGDSYAASAPGNLLASTGTGGAWQTLRKMVKVPAGAQSARVVIAVHGYLGVGAWALDNINLSQELQSLDEVPDGATNSSVRTSQVQNGILPPYSFGDELVVNTQCEVVAANGGAPSNTLGAIMQDGWEIVERSGSLVTAQIEYNSGMQRSGLRTLMIGNSAGSLALDYVVVGMKQRIPVSPGDKFVVRAGIREDYANGFPAGVTREVFFGLRFLDSAGGFLVVRGITFDNAARSLPATMSATTPRLERTVVAPTGATQARVEAYVYIKGTAGTAIPYAISHCRFDDMSVKRITATASGANMLANSEFGLSSTSWGNPGTVTSHQDGKRMSFTSLASGAYLFPYQDIAYGIVQGQPYSASCEVYGTGFDSLSYVQLLIQAYDSVLGWEDLASSEPVFSAGWPASGILKLEVHGARSQRSNVTILRWILVVRGAMSSFQFRKPKFERGIVCTPYTIDESVVYGTELTYRGSRRLLGGPRNIPVGQTMGVGSVRTNTSLSAASTGAVSVAAHSVELNGETVTYSAVANAVVGLTRNVRYVIYTLDPYADGGTRTWYSAASYLAAQTAGEGVVIAGEILIPTAGSGTGGQGGNGDPGGWCVEWDTYLPDGRLVRDLAVGDMVDCVEIASDRCHVCAHPVLSVDIGVEECYRLRTSEGRSIIQSKSTPMQLKDGTFVTTREMFGKQVVLPDLSWANICDLQYLGYRRVIKVNLGNRMFFAGEEPHSCLGTHNANQKP